MGGYASDGVTPLSSMEFFCFPAPTPTATATFTPTPTATHTMLVIHVCDETGNVIETHEHAGDFKEP